MLAHCLTDLRVPHEGLVWDYTSEEAAAWAASDCLKDCEEIVSKVLSVTIGSDLQVAKEENLRQTRRGLCSHLNRMVPMDKWYNGAFALDAQAAAAQALTWYLHVVRPLVRAAFENEHYGDWLVQCPLCGDWIGTLGPASECPTFGCAGLFAQPVDPPGSPTHGDRLLYRPPLNIAVRPRPYSGRKPWVSGHFVVGGEEY